jgi:hypothetical protein
MVDLHDKFILIYTLISSILNKNNNNKVSYSIAIDPTFSMNQLDVYL